MTLNSLSRLTTADLRAQLRFQRTLIRAGLLSGKRRAEVESVIRRLQEEWDRRFPPSSE